jgi:hypothetical protein
MIGRRMRSGATRTITDGPRTGQRVTLLRPSAIEPGLWTAEAPNGASIRVHPDQVGRR